MALKKNKYTNSSLIILSVFVMFIIIYGIMFVQYFSSMIMFTRISSLEFFEVEDVNPENIIGKVGAVSKRNPQLSLVIGDIYSEQYQMLQEDETDNDGVEYEPESSKVNSDVNPLQKEYYNKALYYYRMSLNQNPLLAESHIKVGELYYSGKEYEKSLHAFKIAAKMDRNNAYNLLKIADYYIKMGYFDEGKEMLKKSCGLVNVLLKRSMVIIYEITKNAKDLEEITPNNIDSYMSLGRFLERKGLYKEAMREYLRAKNFDAQNLEPYKSMERLYKSENDMESIVMLWKDALKLNPDNHEVLFKIGSSYIASGEEFIGIETIEKALQVIGKSNLKKSNKIAYHTVLMNTFYRLKDYRKCLSHAEAILKIDKMQAKAYYFKALCEDKTKYDIKGVLFSLRKATEIEPGNIQYRMRLAEAYRDYGFYKNSLKEWEKIASNKNYRDRASREILNLDEMIKQSIR